jgi:hypothetical protein
MGAPEAQASSHSTTQTTLRTLSLNSTATTGRDVKSKSAKIATPALAQAQDSEEVVEASVAGSKLAAVTEVDSAEVTAAAVDTEEEEDMVVAAATVVADFKVAAAMVAVVTEAPEVDTDTTLRLSRPSRRTHSPTSLPLAPSRARSSMCAM